MVDRHIVSIDIDRHSPTGAAVHLSTGHWTLSNPFGGFEEIPWSPVNLVIQQQAKLLQVCENGIYSPKYRLFFLIK